jgi:hypothetical protein
MKSLFELSEEACGLFDAMEAFAEENGGEVPPDLDARIEAIAVEREAKIGAICAVYKELCGRAEILSAEAKKLSARAKSVAGQAEALKGYLQRNLTEGEKVEVGTHRVSWRKSSSVELVDGVAVEDIPELFQRKRIEFAKDDAKRAITAGEDLWFAQLVEKKNIQIG